MFKFNRSLLLMLSLIVVFSVVNCGSSSGPNNAKPVVTVGSDQVIDEGQPMNYVGSFSWGLYR
jgi:hypothetical protein